MGFVALFVFKDKEVSANPTMFVWLHTLRCAHPFKNVLKLSRQRDKRNPYLEQAVISNCLKVIRPLCPTAEISSA